MLRDSTVAKFCQSEKSPICWSKKIAEVIIILKSDGNLSLSQIQPIFKKSEIFMGVEIFFVSDWLSVKPFQLATWLSV